MAIKPILYVITFFLSIWSLEGLRIENAFKKGRILQIKILFFMLSFSLSYLVTNFIYDFCFSTIIK